MWSMMLSGLLLVPQAALCDGLALPTFSEPLMEIAKSYNVSHMTISRL